MAANPSRRSVRQKGANTQKPPQAQAVVVYSPTVDKFTLLESALVQAGFWSNLTQARRRAKVKPEDFQILIKPDLTFFDKGGSTGTDPVLVEHLIDLLHERGYSCVAVGEGRNSFDLWLENRDVLVLADLAGYRFVTEHDHPYDVLDLTEDLAEVPFPAGSVLHGAGLARAWVEADYRICFAKNKTDEETFYALCLHTLLGVLPLRDKDYHYHHRLKPEDVIVDLLKQTPVHFSLIDAFVSNHGSAGSRLERPLETRTIIASGDPLLADWVAATKMDLDPFSSPINAAALRRIGLPMRHKIKGDLAPYTAWINVHPFMADSVQRRNEWAELSRTLKPWLQRVNQELFPFKDIINEQINTLAMRYLANIDENPLARWGRAGLNYWLGAVHDSLEAYQTLYDKRGLRWQEVPLNLDLATYPLADYEAVVAYLQPLAELIQQTPADPSGLRWRYLDGSVLFEFSRVIPAPYEDFVARVDISKAIQFMNDYIGGMAVPVARDTRGRVTHQAERNLYLPQPNYLVLYHGKVIDVTKLEYICYGDQEQKIFWKTIKSENGSAEFDDGIITFAKTSNEETLVSVVGRQQFTLPLFWQVFNLDYNPPLKGFLIAQAYTTFFSQTMANFEARYEGRDVRIGRPWYPHEGESGVTSAERWPTEQISALFGKVSEVVGQNWSGAANIWSWPSQSGGVTAGEVDEAGFIHFKGEPAPENGQETVQPARGQLDGQRLLTQVSAMAREFLLDLITAMEKDWGLHQEKDD